MRRLGPTAGVLAAAVVVLLGVVYLYSGASESNLVICVTPTATYGYTITYAYTGSYSTLNSGGFSPIGTLYQTLTTTAPFSTNPGYEASISSLGQCTFTKP